MNCDVRPDYARDEVAWEVDRELGVANADCGDLHLRLAADLDLEDDDGRLIASRRLDTDENAFCALTWSDDAHLPGDFGEAFKLIYETGQSWRRWLERGRFPDHPWRGELQRSALTLKGLMYAPSGGMVAAATTSLPETPGGERNWDYRYTWIRDATFTLWGLHVLGLDEEATDFMGFVESVCRDTDLQIMYGIGGEKELTESTLDHLSGYVGSQPVRIGNAAYAQHQNDVYGALLDSIYIHSRALGGVSDSLWELAALQVEAAIEIWERPDQGIWEARDDPKHYVSSKLMCWVALDRGHRLARARGDRERAERWSAEADRIKEGHPRQRRQRPRRLPPALRHRRARRLHPADPAGPLPARRRRAGPRHRARDRRRAHRARVSSSVTASIAPTMASAESRARSRSARSGSSRRWPRSASTTTPAVSASGCSTWAGRSTSTPRRSNR